MRNVEFETLKHYVWHPQTVCLTVSDMLFDNFNTRISCMFSPCFVLTYWLSGEYEYMRNTRIFVRKFFRMGFGGTLAGIY